MTEGCIFCQIVAGEAEASVIYEDDATFAFLDIRQFNDGHALVVTKRHIIDIFDLDEATGGAVMTAVRRVAEAVREAFRPDGINIWQSNGAPFQEVMHLHFHVLPRWRDDGILRFPPARATPERAVLDEQAARIRAALRLP